MLSVLRVLADLASSDMAAVGGVSVFVMVVEGTLSFAAGFFGYEDLKNGIQSGDRRQMAWGLAQICVSTAFAYAAIKWPSIVERLRIQFQRKQFPVLSTAIVSIIAAVVAGSIWWFFVTRQTESVTPQLSIQGLDVHP